MITDWNILIKYISSHNRYLLDKYVAIYTHNYHLQPTTEVSPEEAVNLSIPPYTAMWNIIYEYTTEEDCIERINNMLEILECSGCSKHFLLWFERINNYEDFSQWLADYKSSTRHNL